MHVEALTATDDGDCEKVVIQQSLRSQLVHDLGGVSVTANGFAGELELARQRVLELLEGLPPDTDSDIRQELQFQLMNEMQHCLFRINESLSNLDKTIERIRAA